jgi:hypothetical protein
VVSAWKSGAVSPSLSAMVDVSFVAADRLVGLGAGTESNPIIPD